MSKAWGLGFGVIGLGAVVAYFRSDTLLGVLVASLCLIVGLVVIVASEARGLVERPGAARRMQAQVMVVVKEDVHVCPTRDGHSCEIHDPGQADLEFDVFLNCWLVLASELALQLASVQLTLKGADGSTRAGMWVKGDLGSWLFARVEKVSAGGADWKKANLQTVVSFTELDIATPLDCGVSRQGWLHFRIPDITPAELKSGSLELSIRDSSSHEHATVVDNPLQLPGKVTPLQQNSSSETASNIDKTPLSHKD